MDKLALYKFIHDNNIEYHWYGEEVIIMPYTFQLHDFNKLFTPNHFDDEGIECTMRDGYFCFEMSNICEYADIDMEEIFTKDKEQ